MIGLRDGPRLLAMLAVLGLALACLASCTSGKHPGSEESAAWVKIEGATYADTDACITCHEDQSTHLAETLHGKKNDPRTPAAKHQCQSCHGPGSVHVKNHEDDKEGLNDIIRFSAKAGFPPAQLTAQCLSCHESMTKSRWHSTLHALNDVSCVSCHSAHSPKGKPQLKLENEVETCAQCHKDVRAQLERPSHHPVREGKLTCSNCHTPHGSGHDKEMKKTGVNDTCFQCHQDKRGPFLHEHPPVFDNCANCHTPHGSNNTRLLLADPSDLCQMCHQGSGHFGLYDNSTSIEGGGSPSGRAWAPGTRSMGRGCLNCHTKIHGSNHPSGMFFNR
ncbi:MAG: DmsE family decaheme c-type cytochrome [Planctomycetes bacterium]|nr:DmsE family decaheme c-type cytochrome [Planctomycetota bacterium]